MIKVNNYIISNIYLDFNGAWFYHMNGVKNMYDDESREAISVVFELFPVFRRIFFDALYENTDERVRHITKVQFLLLTALISYGQMNMSQTALCISSSKEQATRIVAPLVDAGLLERFYDKTNRRAVYIRLSEKGMSFMRGIRTDMCKHVLKKLSLLSQDDIKTLEESALNVAHILRKIEK